MKKALSAIRDSNKKLYDKLIENEYYKNYMEM